MAKTNAERSSDRRCRDMRKIADGALDQVTETGIREGLGFYYGKAIAAGGDSTYRWQFDRLVIEALRRLAHQIA